MQRSNEITASTLLATQVSTFEQVGTTKPSGMVEIADCLDRIQSGHWKEEVAAVREAVAKKDEKLSRKRKLALPAIAFSGLFTRRSNDGLLIHSSILCVDFDGLGDQLDNARELLVTDPHSLAVFVSPSGNGLKVLVPVAAKDNETQHAAFSEYEAYYSSKGLTADKSCKDVSRLCFVSYDPNLWVRNATHTLSLLLPSNTPNTSTSTTPTICTLHPTRQNTETISGNETVAKLSQLKRLKETRPELHNLYEKLVMHRVISEPGRRNETLTELVPFLFRAVSKQVGENLCLVMLELNQGIFTGSQTEQSTSLSTLWNGCEVRYLDELTKIEAEIYASLDERDKTVFRILRDLGKTREGQFFMSCDELELRVSMNCNGWRTLRKFCALQIIAQTVKGQRRQKGVNGRASYYRWLLTTFEQTEAA